MKLEDDEFTIDPILEGVAYVEKRINGKVYTAWVKSNVVSNNRLQCFPDSSLQIDSNTGDWAVYPDTSIEVGDWIWRMSWEDFKAIEWISPSVDINCYNMTTTTDISNTFVNIN